MSLDCINMSVEYIMAQWDVMNIWGCGRITHEQIEHAIANKTINVRRFDDSVEAGHYWNTVQHAERIAYFILNGWVEPILVDVGILGYATHFSVDDGNHRLAAAAYMQHPTIKASPSGAINVIAKYILDPEERAQYLANAKIKAPTT